MSNTIGNKCAICGDYFDDSDTYEYRGVMSCAEHFEELQSKRNEQRQRVMEVTEHSVRSQADGEWANGGYKTMKTDTSGRPITKVKEPLMLQEYEDGKL
jgi:predicted  nucleic acid-binding Zn-ribbon protein